LLNFSWLALARLEAKLGNVERAREVFRDSILRCPNNVHILHAWGHLEQVTEQNENLNVCCVFYFAVANTYQKSRTQHFYNFVACTISLVETRE
jgi:Tfp pilus assembly protein PilF